MFRFIHAADIHLDSPLSGLESYEGAPADEIRGATRRALDNLVLRAIEFEVAFVLIAGDLYDGAWRDHNTGLFFVQQVTKLQKAGIAVYLISGNHDAQSTMTRWLSIPPNPDGSSVQFSHRKVETVLLTELGVAIHGRGFDTPKMTESVIEQYGAPVSGAFNIGVMHTSLETESNDQHARYAPCRISDLQAKGYDYWALGHIHHRKIHAERPWVVFSGNTQGRTIRETGAKGCYVVTVDDRQQVELQFEPLDVFRWELLTIDIAGVNDSDELTNRFRRELGKLAMIHSDIALGIRVEFIGRTPFHETLLGNHLHWKNQIRASAIAELNGEAWVEKIQFRTQPEHSHDHAIESEGLIAELVEYLNELKEDSAKLTAFIDSLSDLRSKLPPEVSATDDNDPGTQPAKLRQLLDEVEPILMARLRGGEQTR
ncbi:MAG: DNA repair exonuclease [Pirellulaceae bacterium]|nr:DNA repair exonuclease [Pirellulaceae bacterium]